MANEGGPEEVLVLVLLLLLLLFSKSPWQCGSLVRGKTLTFFEEREGER